MYLVHAQHNVSGGIIAIIIQWGVQLLNHIIGILGMVVLAANLLPHI